MTRTDEETREFVRLLTRYEREIYAFILSVVPNWADADEILQETTVRLWQGFDRFENGTNFVAWGCKVAHFQILTFRRKMGRERVHFSQEFLEKVVSEFQKPTLSSNNRREALSYCIERLPQKSRTVLQQVYSGGHTIRALAQLLNRTEASLYKTISRTRLILQTCIEQTIKEDIV